ncbi:MAG: hypothetical protein LC624_00020 [Halobacteriales archaeon]|nr:hypothetical protein [Halobacteriales archaeon]
MRPGRVPPSPPWLVVVLLALLVLQPLAALDLAPAAQAQDASGATLPGVAYPWWDAAWHMRVPVLLQPKVVDRINGGLADLSGNHVRNYPALVEVDFTEAIRQAGPEGFGWPKDAQGRLSSFTLDADSVRVVEHDRFKGCPLAVDRTTQDLRCGVTSDRPEDLLVAATFAPGLWANVQPDRDPAFDASRNAVGTLQFAVRGEFGAPRLFFVYFDILQNGHKAPASYPARDAGIVQGTHFIRSGTDILGYAPATMATGPGVLLAQPLYDNTTVAIYKYVSRGVEPALMVQATMNALDSDTNGQAGPCPSTSFKGTVCLDVPQAQPFFFRVVASKPVVVALKSVDGAKGATWYPAKDGGLSGTEFLFRTAQDSEAGGAATPLYILSPSGAASVGWSGDANGFANVDGVGRIGSFGSGDRIHLFASKPVMVVGTGIGADIGLPAVGPFGATVDAQLYTVVNEDLTIVDTNRPTTLQIASPIGIPDDPNALEAEPLAANASNALYHRCACSASPDYIGKAWRIQAKDDGALLWAKSNEAGIFPVGGKLGMSFDLSLQQEHSEGTTITNDKNDARETRVIVMGLYNGTRVVIRDAKTGVERANTTMGLHDWLDKQSGGTPYLPYGSWHVEATKPVAAYFYGPGKTVDPPFATYYVAKTEPPLQAQGAGEFHGFAVGWKDKVATASVGPGERVRLKLSLVNLGRAVGAQPLSDTFDITREVSKPGNATDPAVDLSPARWGEVPSFQGRDVTLAVGVPPDAATGTVYEVNVTATSLGNPNFRDVAHVVITVQIRYEFTMRFLESNGTSLQKIIKPGSTTCLDVEVVNTGTGDMHLDLEASPVRFLDFTAGLVQQFSGACAPGAGTSVIDSDGRPGAPLSLARGARTVLTLVVTAPNDNKPLPFEVEVQGTAEEDASVRQQVSAVVLINVEAKIKLTAEDDTSLVLPGANATYHMRIDNLGDVETPITYGTTGLVPNGWNVSFLDAPGSLKARGAVDALGNSLDHAEFVVNVTAARDAPVALVVPVNVVATSAVVIETGDTVKSFRQSDSAKVTAIVGNNFTLAQPDFAPISINPGEPFPLTYEMRSAANGPFTLRVAAGALPVNWTLAVEEPANSTFLRPGDRVTVRLNITPPRATEAGVYALGVVLAANDTFTQGADVRNFTILVRKTAGFKVDLGVDQLLFAPGGHRELTLGVVNTGNLPVKLRLVASAPGGYGARFPDSSVADLQPGEETKLRMLVDAPSTPAETAQPVKVTATDALSNRQAEFSVPAVTARLDLIVSNLVLATQSFAVGQPAVAAVSVQNRGTIPANNVGLGLIVNGKGVRDEALRTLPPGEARTVTVAWTVDEAPRTVAVQIDPADVFAETDESNNLVQVEVGRGLPGFEPGLLLAAVGAAAAASLMRRRRGGGPDG